MNQTIAKKSKYFPCPYCTRLGLNPIERGDTADMGDDDVGPIMVQIGPDWPCGGCGGEGFVEVGSNNHFNIKCSSAYTAIAKIFGNEFLDNLDKEEYENFWKPIEEAFMSIRGKWIK